MATTFKKIDVGTHGDFALAYLKRDVPCFQFSGFSEEDKATSKDVKSLIGAVKDLANWADEKTIKLSDHYKALHNLEPLKALKTNGMVRIPIDPRYPAGIITLKADKTIIVPPVWYQSGMTNVDWGRFEAALREIVRR